MTIHDDVDGLGFSGSAFGLISSAMVEMMWLNGGSGAWLQNIQSLNRKNKLAYRYRPNFDKLFEKYCRASVRIDYQVFAEQGQPFTPITLARNCALQDMRLSEVEAFEKITPLIHEMPHSAKSGLTDLEDYIFADSPKPMIWLSSLVEFISPYVEITGNESAEELYVLSKVSIYYFHQDKHNK